MEAQPAKAHEDQVTKCCWLKLKHRIYGYVNMTHTNSRAQLREHEVSGVV